MPDQPAAEQQLQRDDGKGGERGPHEVAQLFSSTAIFTSADGGQTFTATSITVPDANGNFGLGIAFGEGDTFWGKGDLGNALRHVQFDLLTGMGTVLRTYTTAQFPATVQPIGVEVSRSLLGGVSIENPDNLRLYSIADLGSPPVLVDQELFPSDAPNINNTGAIDFGDGIIYALDSNNGLMALLLGDISTPPGRITIVRDGDDVTLTWDGNFTLQSSTDIPGNFNDVTNGVNSYTESVTSASERYFRLRN